MSTFRITLNSTYTQLGTKSNVELLFGLLIVCLFALLCFGVEVCRLHLLFLVFFARDDLGGFDGAGKGGVFDGGG